ncbi:hypothetical protein [Roseiconus lacunae]|uniref:hypothetical protein n=1 Tax=Roseiconus lacunae TaxID=2605694 RepID=UPI001E45EADB|nr:hypothetical protein [Roseiconus lacunae]MCD0462086.1 hypothetical protein [Roseiconus lacunae]
MTSTIEVDKGDRVIAVAGATASYRIVELSDATFAVSIQAGYDCGDHRGFAFPFRSFVTRQECVEHFIEVAVRFFSQSLECSITSNKQHSAQQFILQQLDGSPLLGFLEPDPQDFC